MAEGVPYAFIKLCWNAKPWADLEYDEFKTRHAFKTMLKLLDDDSLSALKLLSSFEIEEGVLEKIGKEWRDKDERCD